jgi:hypothetical protein
VRAFPEFPSLLERGGISQDFRGSETWFFVYIFPKHSALIHYCKTHYRKFEILTFPPFYRKIGNIQLFSSKTPATPKTADIFYPLCIMLVTDVPHKKKWYEKIWNNFLWPIRYHGSK